MADLNRHRLLHLPRRNRARLIAVGVALLTVASIAIQVGLHNTARTFGQGPLGPGDFGPKISVVVAPGGSGQSNATAITLQVYAAVPSALRGLQIDNISSSAQATNGYDDQLLNGTIAGNSSSFFLTPTFDTVAQEWAGLFQSEQGTNYPALTVEAEKTVSISGSVYLYQYYNNLPFDPFALQVLDVNQSTTATPAILEWFNGTGIDPEQYSSLTLVNLAFNLTLVFPPTPLQVVAPATGARQLPGVPLSAPRTSPKEHSLMEDSPSVTTYGYAWSNTTTTTLLRVSYLNGTLPLIGVHFSNGADQGASLIALGGSVSVLNDSLNFDSALVYENLTGELSTTISTSPSFSYVANSTTLGVGNGYSASPTRITTNLGNNISQSLNQTSAEVGIPGVEYEFEHFELTTAEHRLEFKSVCSGSGGRPPCQVTYLSNSLVRMTLDGNFTISEIADVNTTDGLQVQAGYVPYFADAAVSRLFETFSNGTVTLQPSGTNSSFQGYAIWGDTNGYSAAGTAFARATHALAEFPTAMGIGLTMATFNALGPQSFGADEFAAVAVVLNRIAQIIEMSSQAASFFESISYFSGFPEAIGVATSLTSAPAIGSGSPYLMAYYETETPIWFTVASGTYSFYAPMDYLNATALG